MTAQTSTIAEPLAGGSQRHNFVKRHPLVSFFVLANLLSWLAWIPYILSNSGLGIWDYNFPEFLGTTQLLGVLPGAYLGPIFSAFLVTAIADGKQGMRAWVGRLLRWRVSWRWYLGAVLITPAILFVAGALLSGGNFQAPGLLVLVAYIPGLVLQMVTTGLAEEPGWRDFALPRLQKRGGPLLAILVLGPIWGVWHLPLFFTEWGGWPDASWTRPVTFIAFCIVFNIVMIWVFNRSGESLPIAILVHAGINNFATLVWSSVFPVADAETVQFGLLGASIVVAGILLITTRGKLGYRPQH